MADRRPIYLDYNATTPIDPAVREAMLPYLTDHFGNPSSTHAYGKEAHAAVETARRQVAELIGAEPDEIVFTGGGSEASNQAIKGTCLRQPRGLFARLFGSSAESCHIITTAVEHPATLQPVEFLRRLGCRATVLPVDRLGMVDPDAVRRAITPQTRLVSVMHSNNEVGTLMPIEETARHCRAAGVLVHTDCAQSLGKLPVNVRELGVDFLTIAGAQALRPEGSGSALRPAGRVAGTADPRRRARGCPPGGDGERSVHCRPWQGRRTGRSFAAGRDRSVETTA
jgi:cysteine desulfurase